MAIAHADPLSAARDAIDCIRPSTHVVAGALAAQPRYLLRALGDKAQETRGIALSTGMLTDGYDYLADGRMRYRTWFPPGTLTTARPRPGAVEYLPMSWSQLVEWLAGPAKVDVVLVQVAPADPDGNHSLGVSSSYLLPAIEAASVVIGEVNQRMPRTCGAKVQTSVFTSTIDVDYQLPSFPARQPGELDVQIARQIVAMLPAAPCIQVGVGAIPDAVVRALARADRRDIKLHSVLTNSVLELSAADGLSDADDAMVVGEILGDQELYDFVDGNERVRLVGGRETHSLSALASLRNFCAINSALSVDLFGQINSEYIGGRHLGALGGLADFARGGLLPGNLSVTALRSTTADGSSRIVPVLDTPTVTLSRDMTQIVVTEHGVADLRGKSVTERARALAGIADPRFRDDLSRVAP